MVEGYMDVIWLSFIVEFITYVRSMVVFDLHFVEEVCNTYHNIVFATFSKSNVALICVNCYVELGKTYIEFIVRSKFLKFFSC